MNFGEKQRDKQERAMQRQRPQDTTKSRGTSKKGQCRDRGHKTPQKTEGQARKDNAETEATRHHKKQKTTHKTKKN
jgi:hypothetical protein